MWKWWRWVLVCCLVFSWFCLLCINNRPHLPSHPLRQTHTQKYNRKCILLQKKVYLPLFLTPQTHTHTHTVSAKQFIIFYFPAIGDSKSWGFHIVMRRGRKRQYRSPRKIRGMLEGQVLCKKLKGQGSLNSLQPDVLTLKVTEIEKMIHSHGWWLHLPSVPCFLSSTAVCLKPFFGMYNNFSL